MHKITILAIVGLTKHINLRTQLSTNSSKDEHRENTIPIYLNSY